ncbi:MAG: hypothetical protein ACPG1C_10935 [Alphaproteobacteria bacterium]
MTLMRLVSKTVVAAGFVVATAAGSIGVAHAADNWDNDTWDQYRRMMAEQDGQSGIRPATYKEPVQKKEWKSADGNVTLTKAGAQNRPAAGPVRLASASSGNASAPATRPATVPGRTMPAQSSSDRQGEQVALGAAGLSSLIVIALGIAALL